MCGIAGFAGWPFGDEEAARTVRTMCDAIVHRGPDDSGYFVAPEVALGMRRLSIIDVGGGQQPIGNEDGSIQVVFNGEIYNHHDLRRELVAGGHRFRTRSDTETIVHLYEDMGADFVARLRGMFAIALWDARTKRLVLARDRVGIKPLSYWLAPDGIAFCSELRSLLALSRFPRRLDERGIAAFLSLGYVPDPLAVFAGVAKLPPGHVLTWCADRGAAVRRYWTPIGLASDAVDEAAAQQRVRDLLADAVGSHLETRSEEHTSELQSHVNLVCRLLLEKKKKYGEIVIADLCHGDKRGDARHCRDVVFFFSDSPTTEIYTLSLHDALPISSHLET